MKYERGSFITVASRDTLRGMHPTAQALYMWLSSYANETGNCFPSRKTLANDIGCSERTVDTMVDVLVEKGLVEVKGRKEGDRQLSNLYKVLIVPPLAGDATPPSRTYSTPLQNLRTNSNHLTQPIEGDVSEDGTSGGKTYESEEEARPKTASKYANARKVFKWLPNPQASWNDNLTELKCGNLLYSRGEENVRKFVRYVKANEENEDFNWTFTKPSDYERKWNDIKAYAKRNS